MHNVKKFHAVTLAVSLTLNAASGFLIAAALLPQRDGSLSYLSFFRQGRDNAYAFIVTLPPQNAAAAFGTMEISLQTGDACTVQYSFFPPSGQINIAFDPLYDHNVVSVERSGGGIAVRALAPGQCLLQSVSAEGIFSIALVTVTE